MRQRSLELFQHVPIDVGFQALDFQTHLLAELPGHVADQPREALRAIAKGTHAADDHFVIQPGVEILGVSRMIVEGQ